jgi:hypothetical protein
MTEATITSSDAPAGSALPAAPASPGGIPPEPSGGAPTDWRASLPAELRDAPSLAKFADPGALAKSYVEAEGLIGRKGLIIPTEKDAPEVHARFRAALGVPEKPEGYTLKAPEGIPPEAWGEDGVKALATWAHELGLTPAQAQGVADRYAKVQAEGLQRAAEGIEPDGRKMEDVLRQEWGVGYDGKLEVARRAAKQFGGDGVLDALEAKTGGAAMLRMFAAIGEAMAEDRPAGMGTGRGAGDPKAELKDIMKSGSPYWQPLHPEHRNMVQRAKELFARDAA